MTRRVEPTAQWSSLVVDVRGVFSGRLATAFNWPVVVPPYPSWASALGAELNRVVARRRLKSTAASDYVGVDCYFRLDVALPSNASVPWQASGPPPSPPVSRCGQTLRRTPASTTSNWRGRCERRALCERAAADSGVACRPPPQPYVLGLNLLSVGLGNKPIVCTEARRALRWAAAGSAG